jgi:hypothetical protein
MGAKTKKEAGSALSELKDYLCRDRKALEKISLVERYLGELRRKLAEVNDELETKQRTTDTLKAKVAEHDTVVRDLNEQLGTESAKRRQAENAKVTLQRDYERRLGEFKFDSPDQRLTGSDVMKLMQVLKKRSPKLLASATLEELSAYKANLTFDIGDFVHNCSEEEFITLGMLVAAFGLFGINKITFNGGGITNRIFATDEEHTNGIRQVANWMHECDPDGTTLVTKKRLPLVNKFFDDKYGESPTELSVTTKPRPLVAPTVTFNIDNLAFEGSEPATDMISCCALFAGICGGAYVPARIWVAAAQDYANRKGLEQFLVNFLTLLRASLGDGATDRPDGEPIDSVVDQQISSRLGCEMQQLITKFASAPELPAPTAQPKFDDDAGLTQAASWTQSHINGLILNPLFTGVYLYTRLPGISDSRWIDNVMRVIKEDGFVQTLTNILNVTRRSLTTDRRLVGFSPLDKFPASVQDLSKYKLRLQT